MFACYCGLVLHSLSQPDVLCGGGEKDVWSLSHTFCDLSECNYITGVPSMSVMSFGAEA